MSTQFAVYHSEKGKSGATQIGYHMDRVEGKEFSYQHADPSRKHLNRYFTPGKFKDISLTDAINERIKEGYTGKTAIRKDAVKFLTHIFSGSHERMEELSKDKDKFNKWINANYQFACREFGEKNIVRFVLHMDERTPHIHCVTVPLTHEGKLSAKIKFGNRERMRKRQDDYAEAMKPFGLERGARTVGVKHESAREYYQRIDSNINPTDKISVKLADNPKAPFIKELPPLVNRKDWILRQNETISRTFVKEIQKSRDYYKKAYDSALKTAVTQKTKLTEELSKEKKKNQVIEVQKKVEQIKQKAPAEKKQISAAKRKKNNRGFSM